MNLPLARLGGSRAARSFVAALALGVLAPDTRGQCEVAQLSGSGGGDDFGRSVSINGKVAVVGDPRFPAPGAAYCFRWDGMQWSKEETLMAPNPATEDQFGKAVAVSGDVAVIGAPGTNAPEFQRGAAYIFRYEPQTLGWELETCLTASDGDAGDLLGFSVSIDGDVVVVGARDDENDGILQSGAAYVFRYNGSDWIEEAKLTDPQGEAGDLFGVSVSVSGDVAIVGAHGNNGPGNDSGAAFVFRYDGMEWMLDSELIASDAVGSERFGFSVSISGTVAVVGAYQDSDDGNASGSAYVYRYVGSAWFEEVKLTASDATALDWFGRSVAVSSDTSTILIGATRDDDEGPESGSTYVFRDDGADWHEAIKLTASDGGANHKFGASVSVDRHVALVGAHRESEDPGAAYVFGGISGLDCNDNGVADSCDIFAGASEDLDGSGIPDECELLGDANGDRVVNVLDLIDVLLCFGQPGVRLCASADIDHDGAVNVDDLLIILDNWGSAV